MDHNLYQIVKIILGIFWKRQNESIDNPSLRRYVDTNGSKITFKIKTGYSLDLLTPGTKKLLGKTENKTTKDKNGKNVLQLEITEVIQVYYNILNNDHQQDLRVSYTFAPNKLFGNLLKISPTNCIFLGKHLIQNFNHWNMVYRLK